VLVCAMFADPQKLSVRRISDSPTDLQLSNVVAEITNQHRDIFISDGT
jgi:hypothetical protein